ncbi:hypothetical protein CHUAL_009931 [Chamberlinius hualienensis]
MSRLVCLLVLSLCVAHVLCGGEKKQAMSYYPYYRPYNSYGYKKGGYQYGYGFGYNYGQPGYGYGCQIPYGGYGHGGYGHGGYGHGGYGGLGGGYGGFGIPYGGYGLPYGGLYK